MIEAPPENASDSVRSSSRARDYDYLSAFRARYLREFGFVYDFEGVSGGKPIIVDDIRVRAVGATGDLKRSVSVFLYFIV
jgi:hypothetical protein